jgi:hypothetical protein
MPATKQRKLFPQCIAASEKLARGGHLESDRLASSTSLREQSAPLTAAVPACKSPMPLRAAVHLQPGCLQLWCLHAPMLPCCLHAPMFRTANIPVLSLHGMTVPASRPTINVFNLSICPDAHGVPPVCPYVPPDFQCIRHAFLVHL